MIQATRLIFKDYHPKAHIPSPTVKRSIRYVDGIKTAILFRIVNLRRILKEVFNDEIMEQQSDDVNRF